MYLANLILCMKYCYLDVVRPQDNPATNSKSKVEDTCTDEKSQNIRSRSLHRQKENLKNKSYAL